MSVPRAVMAQAGVIPPPPWEQKIKRYFERQQGLVTRDRVKEREEALQRRLERDPSARAGLPPHASTAYEVPGADAFGPPGLTPAPVPAPTLPPNLLRMDLDNDGAISRREYLQGRDRLVPVGPGSATRQRLQMERMGSRFRAADTNGDGRVTAQELDGSGIPRF